MKATQFAIVFALGIATSSVLFGIPAWVHRPALPGDQFQLAEGNGTMARKQFTEGNGTMTRSRVAVGEATITPAAKGDGWM